MRNPLNFGQFLRHFLHQAGYSLPQFLNENLISCCLRVKRFPQGKWATYITRKVVQNPLVSLLCIRLVFKGFSFGNFHLKSILGVWV